MSFMFRLTEWREKHEKIFDFSYDCGGLFIFWS